MRLWHCELFPYLPKSQLLAQKRECDLIWKDIKNGKKTNHILIRYIWYYEDYEEQFMQYYCLLKKEFENRNLKFVDNSTISCSFFIFDPKYKDYLLSKPFKNQMNDGYIKICYYNLLEKFLRLQKDFYNEIYVNLHNFVVKRLGGKI